MSTFRLATLAAAFALLCAATSTFAEAGRRDHAARHRHRGHSAQQPRSKPEPHVGQDQRGTASVYAGRFHGRQTADGTRFDAGSDTAASKTLPLGTTARVTNLETGKTATVQVRDHGPRRRDRIIDVSPGTAGALGMDRKGTAPVAVTPIAPPGGQGR